MGIVYNTSIVRNGLVLHLDAANPKSYPGSGTLWTNLTADGNNGTLYNGPTYDLANKGSVIFDGVNDYVDVSLATTTSRTVNIIYKLTNPASGWGPLWRVEDWKERIFPGGITLIDSSQTYYSLNGPPADTNTVNICYSYNGTKAKSYKNGQSISNITMGSTMNSGTYTYRFGNQSSGSSNAFVNMNLYYVAFYNRQLTDAEVKQNFEALRGRYGL